MLNLRSRKNKTENKVKPTLLFRLIVRKLTSLENPWRRSGLVDIQIRAKVIRQRETVFDDFPIDLQ